MYLELFGKILSEESLSLIIVLELLWLIVFFFCYFREEAGDTTVKEEITEV